LETLPARTTVEGGLPLSSSRKRVVGSAGLLLGQVREVDGKFEAAWSNELGRTMVENFGRESEAVQHVARINTEG
jgi:hypothetical protein